MYRKKILILIAIGIIPLFAIPAYAFEPDLYDGFFITYGNCEVTINAESETIRIILSKFMNESTQGSFCDLLENSKFEYDYTDSGEIWAKRIKFDKEEPVRFFTILDDERLNVVLGENWMVGKPLRYSVADITELQYIGMNKKQINGKILQVHEFGAETYVEEGDNVAEIIVNIQYDSETGFLISFKQELTVATMLGGGWTALDFEAADISEKPIIENIMNTKIPDGGGCLIASATYGSELSPQVQMLREIRDNSLLQTQSGQAFMQSFNEFYYSFSPIIADYERENPVFREIVKIGIMPLIASLSILNYVDMDSESDVLTYGASLILINLGMYFVAPAVGIAKLSKLRNKRMSHSMK